VSTPRVYNWVYSDLDDAVKKLLKVPAELDDWMKIDKNTTIETQLSIGKNSRIALQLTIRTND
jgi:UDP-3-O-[3-hydroxymyristoyl] glucosamine N-acyltransferase